MNYFHYKTVAYNGKIQSTTIQLPFDDCPAVKNYLERQGKTVVVIYKSNFIIAFLLNFLLFIDQKKITSSHVEEYLQNISLMLRAGLPLLTALEEAGSGTDEDDNKALIQISSDIILSIQAGLSFSDALDSYQKIFPKSITYLVKIGEETGKLEQTLLNAVTHLKKMSRIKSSVKKAMIYPLMVFVSTIGAVVFWMYYVIPNLLGLFQNMQVQLPPATKALLAMSDFVTQHGLETLGVFLFILFSIILIIEKNQVVRYQFHKMLFILPITKKIVRPANLAFIFEYLSLLVTAGIDIATGLTILSDSISNEVYRDKFKNIHQGLLLGNSISEEFSKTDILPSYIIRMVNAGEQSGTLERQYKYIAEHYQEKLNDTIEQLSELIKPLALLFVGGIFIFVIIALFLPIYDLVGSVGKLH